MGRHQAQNPKEKTKEVMYIRNMSMKEQCTHTLVNKHNMAEVLADFDNECG